MKVPEPPVPPGPAAMGSANPDKEKGTHMKDNTFMDNAAIGAVLVAILVNVLHGAYIAAGDESTAPTLATVEVPHG